LHTFLYDKPSGGASARGASEMPADNSAASAGATSSSSSQPPPPGSNTSEWSF